MKRQNISERSLVALAYGIAEGRWSPGNPLPATRELAAELGVSAPTAVKVVRLAAERSLVSLRANRPAVVLPDAPRAAREVLDEYAHIQAEREAGSLTRIAMLFAEIEWPLKHPPHLSLRQHLDLQAAKADLQLDLVCWPQKNQVRFAQSLPSQGYAGAICLSTPEIYHAGLLALQGQKFPAVLVNRWYRHVGLPMICGDDYKPCRDLALRLARMGHRNMALMADILPRLHRHIHHGAIRGWVDGLIEAGVYRDCPIPVNTIPGYEEIIRNPRVFEQVLLRPDRPTALLFYWPIWSDVFLTDPRFARFRVPEDISLVLALPGERPRTLPDAPPLSTLDYDYPRMASCIVKTISDLIAGKPCAELLQLPLKLNLTESVGPPPKG